MSSSMLQLFLFFAIGVLWNVVRPMSMDAVFLRRALTALLFGLFIPAYALLWIWQVPLDGALLKFVLLGLLSIGLNFLVIWFVLKNKRWPLTVKGSLIIALSFSAVFTHGMPLLANVVGGWGARLALEMLLLVMMPLTLIVGVMVAYHFAEKKQPLPDRGLILRQPIFWLTILGLSLNIANVSQPLWLNSVLEQLIEGITPLMILTAGMAMKWQKNWNRIASKIWPYVFIPVLITPLSIWASVMFLGGVGPKTFMSLMLLAVMPSSLLGFYLCEQYRLELATYNIAYTLSVGLSIIAMPLLYWALHNGLVRI